jgi:hypothetical protein
MTVAPPLSPSKPSSRRLVIIGGLIAAGTICFFILLPCTLRELGSRAVLGRDISHWSQVDSAVRVYRMERGHYPASLDAPDFQPYIDEHVIAFLHEGRVTYHPPAADSPPTFTLVHMTTPRGDYSTQLDGTRLYPNSK